MQQITSSDAQARTRSAHLCFVAKPGTAFAAIHKSCQVQ
jgi:hypothetical protein